MWFIPHAKEIVDMRNGQSLTDVSLQRNASEFFCKRGVDPQESKVCYRTVEGRMKRYAADSQHAAFLTKGEGRLRNQHDSSDSVAEIYHFDKS